MIKLDVKLDVKAITASIAQIAKEQEKAVVRALNKTAAQARTEAARSVRAAGYNIKIAAIKKSFTISKARSRHLVVTLKSTGEQIKLINYGARQSKSGVSVQVLEGRQVLRHVFLAKNARGGVGIFERVDRQGGKHKVVVRNGKKVRIGLPIKELFGPSIPQALSNEIVEKALMDKIREKFPAILAHEVQWLAMSK